MNGPAEGAALRVERIDPHTFDRWPDVLAVIDRAFAPMHGVIDPPSSAALLTSGSLARKAAEEAGFVAWGGGAVTGCAFAADRPDCLYLGKLAVDPAAQGAGIGRRILGAVESLARSLGKPALLLQTRVELSQTHAVFARWGFREIGRTAHPGFDRPTSITMRKDLG